MQNDSLRKNDLPGIDPISDALNFTSSVSFESISGQVLGSNTLIRHYFILN